jgi:hypothetical protein
LFLCRIVGAVVVGLLVYYYLHPGGSGGWGLGGGGFGLGGGGTGPGSGGSGTSAETRKADNARTTVKTVAADTLRIEMLGGGRYKGEGRYYLIQGKQSARNLEEVETLLKQNKGRYRKLEIVIYPDSVAAEHPATTRLSEQANQYGLLLSISRADRPMGDGADKK